MLKRLTESLKYRLNNYSYYEENKDKLGLSRKDYLGLKNNWFDQNENLVIEFHGFRTVFTSSYWFLHSIQEIFIDEVYRFRSTNDHPTILDCGANIGLSLLYFSSLFPDARITAFEADSNIFRLLEANVREFGLANVHLYNKAVWASNSTRNFNPDGQLGGRLDQTESFGDRSSEIETIRLRDHLDKKIDFLKLDIEGAEYEVLKDCADELGNVENLFVEYHVMPREPQHLVEILNWIKEAGFRYYITEAADNQKHPFIDKTGVFYDMQLNISCYRV